MTRRRVSYTFIAAFCLVLSAVFSPARAAESESGAVESIPQANAELASKIDSLKTMAQSGNPFFERALGAAYVEQKDYAQALTWYEKAADQNDVDAILNIAHFYNFGIGVEKDMRQAFQWYLKAAELGSAQAQNDVGYLYYRGRGVPRDYKQSIEWTQKAAAQDFPMAYVNLAMAYMDGAGVAKDNKKAFELLQQGAAHGLAVAYYDLGRMYMNGLGTEKDQKTAFENYKKAADREFASAQNAVGYCYHFGIGVDEDVNKALEWYERAAKLGDPLAMHNTAFIYHAGLPWAYKDPVKAYAWYMTAAHYGYTDSVANLKQLVFEMSASQIEEGRKLGEDYIAKYKPTQDLLDAMRERLEYDRKASGFDPGYQGPR